jgi:DNA-binding NarL/FixJ family response regulator
MHQRNNQIGRALDSEAAAPAAKGSIRVLLIDDQRNVRSGLRTLIESWPGVIVIGEADNASDAIAIAGREFPDVVLLDLLVDGDSGLDYIPRLLAVSRLSRILILTAVDDAAIHRRADALGGMGLALKNHTTESLRRVIEKVHSGEGWHDPPVVFP